MDAISLRGVRAYGRHGVSEAERAERRLIELDVTVEMDLRRAQRTDALEQTLDYAQLYERLVRIVSTTSFSLLERLGGELLDAIFTDRRVARAQLTLAKPGRLDGATPSVTLVRESPGYRAG